MELEDITRLKKWFLENKRSFPWRESSNAYHVWVSEVMLQQTQASVVVPYFLRWMERFPTLEDLGQAPVEDVVKLWEGLGYYARARTLHAAAVELVQKGEGVPSCPKALSQIKGIGPYTQGAILSFAYKKKAPAVDGNVLRVLARYWGIEQEIDRLKTQKEIRQRWESVLPDIESPIVSEGMIELGALVCQKKPACGKCPIKKGCTAFRDQRQFELPKRTKRPSSISIERTVAVIRAEGHFLVLKNPFGKVMAGLYEFPYIDAHFKEKEEVQTAFQKKLSLPVVLVKKMPIQRHTYTKYRVTLYPFLFNLEPLPSGDEWHLKENLKRLPFSSGHRRILEGLM